MKIIKPLITLIFIATTIFDCYSQRNLKDSLGRKQGLWIEYNPLIQAYYKDDQLNGVYRVYSRLCCTLTEFGEYSNGKPIGKWHHFAETDKPMQGAVYKDNKLDGVYQYYSQVSCTVVRFGEYSKGSVCGKWYYFDEVGYLQFTEENIKKNVKYTLKRDDGVRVPYEFTSYLRDYYPNGIVKDEGQVLYNEDVQIDNDKVGQWKYYDQNGRLLKTVNKGIRSDLDE